jgi:hypothetical protein
VNYISSGATTGTWFNTANPGSSPFRSTTDGTYVATAWAISGTATSGGIQNDAAPIDVPTLWGVTQPQVAYVAAWNDRPNTSGYGLNIRNSKNRLGGSSGANLSNQLVTLPAGFNLYNGNPASADSKTIFDTQIAWAPILPFANYGTGITQLTYTQLQHLFVTGRLPSGENLHAVTRDTGSGTHNGMMNSLGIDPSWGVGENVGPLNTGAANQTLGSTWWPGNKGSSGSLDSTLRNVRLGVGYGGGERFNNNSIWQFAELIAVGNDLGGRTPDFVRPTMDAILDNGLRGDIDSSTNSADRPRTVNPSGTTPCRPRLGRGRLAHRRQGHLRHDGRPPQGRARRRRLRLGPGQRPQPRAPPHPRCATCAQQSGSTTSAVPLTCSTASSPPHLPRAATSHPANSSRSSSSRCPAPTTARPRPAAAPRSPRMTAAFPTTTCSSSSSAPTPTTPT